MYIYISLYTQYIHVIYHDCFLPKSGLFATTPIQNTSSNLVFRKVRWKFGRSTSRCPCGALQIGITSGFRGRCANALWDPRGSWSWAVQFEFGVDFVFSGGDGIWGYKHACIKQLGIQWISQHLLSSQHGHLIIYSGLVKDFHAKVATMKMAWHFKTQSVELIDICLTFTMSVGVSRIYPSTVYWPSQDTCMFFCILL